MDDFAAKPGSPNATGSITNEANAIAPHKRPLSSQTPTIVLKDGKLFFAVGGPGAQTIPNAVLQVILNIIDHGGLVTEAPPREPTFSDLRNGILIQECSVL